MRRIALKVNSILAVALLGVFATATLHAQGTPLREATIEACRLRFRPIVMTGLAFICGVLPMVIASGASAKSQQALGTGVMGGMIAVVILALLMVPIFFVFVRRTFSKAEADPAAAAAVSETAPRKWWSFALRWKS